MSLTLPAKFIKVCSKKWRKQRSIPIVDSIYKVVSSSVCDKRACSAYVSCDKAQSAHVLFVWRGLAGGTKIVYNTQKMQQKQEINNTIIHKETLSVNYASWNRKRTQHCCDSFSQPCFGKVGELVYVSSSLRWILKKQKQKTTAKDTTVETFSFGAD